MSHQITDFAIPVSQRSATFLLYYWPTPISHGHAPLPSLWRPKPKLPTNKNGQGRCLGNNRKKKMGVGRHFGSRITCGWSILSKGIPPDLSPPDIFTASLLAYQNTYLLCKISQYFEHQQKLSLRPFLH